MRDHLAATFDDFVSESIQHLVHEMGTRLLADHPALAEVSFTAENHTRDPVGEQDGRKVYTDPFPAQGADHADPHTMSLTTHVLDTSSGIPAAGVAIELRRDGEMAARQDVTNADGRATAAAARSPAGEYELVFAVGDYFGERAFLDRVPVRFTIADPDAHYHVPLLVSPWSYSTYRGS